MLGDNKPRVNTMGHALHAIIGPAETVAGWAKSWLAPVLRLPQNFLLAPLSHELHDDVVELMDIEKSPPFPEFVLLSAGIDLALRIASRQGPIGYIETDYFGGVGSQSAIAWSEDKVILGPLQTESTWVISEIVQSPPGERAINQVLAKLGVWTRGGLDEFDMLELSSFRSTESALKRSVPIHSEH